MMTHILSPLDCYDKILHQNNPFFDDYLAFYSSLLDGITLTPQLMQIPLDDHMVHRGDGVFEAMKVISGQIYLFDAHLQRLFYSASCIGLSSPWRIEEIKAKIQDTLWASKQDKASIRVFLSRGPGDFSANPYDSIGPQLYVVVMRLKEPKPEKYISGVTIGKSQIPTKQDWMSQIKSCNYLPNVLMKREAVDRGLDFVIGVDERGNLTESSTENIMIVDKQGTLVHPFFDRILKGTTMLRVCELAAQRGMKTAMRHIQIDEIKEAQEIFMVGTSINVLPVVKYENQNIQTGLPGRIAKTLNGLLLQDQGVVSRR